MTCQTLASKPQRVQLSRRKGWRMPPNTVFVARPSRWGNFYRIGNPMCLETIRRWGHRLRDFGNVNYCCATAAEAVRKFAGVLAFDEAIWPALRRELSGKNLACWCELCPDHASGKPFDIGCPNCAPCHVDVLGPLANQPLASKENGE